MEINSKVIDAYIDSNNKGRYVLVIRNNEKLFKIRNTFLVNSKNIIKKGDSIFKSKNSMVYYVYRNGKLKIYESTSKFD